MIDAPLTVASHQLPLVKGAGADQGRPARGESMRFVRITKSTEEVGKVILCTDVFSFIGATWEVGGGGVRVHQDRTAWWETGKPDISKNLLELQHENMRVHKCECRLVLARFCSVATYDAFCFFHF